MYPLLLLETEELEARKVDAKNWPFSFKYFHKIYSLFLTVIDLSGETILTFGFNFTDDIL